MVTNKIRPLLETRLYLRRCDETAYNPFGQNSRDCRAVDMYCSCVLFSSIGGAKRGRSGHYRSCGAALLGLRSEGCGRDVHPGGQRSPCGLQSFRRSISVGKLDRHGEAAEAAAQPAQADTGSIGRILFSRCTGDRRIASGMRRWTVGFAAAAAAFAITSPAQAQSQISSVCGVTGTATAPASITYDPFSPGGLSEVTIPLILRRNRGILLGRTDEVSLVIVAPTGSPPLDVTYRGFRVIYPEGSTAGRPRSLDSRDNGAGSAGEIRYNFGGILSSDLSNPLNLRVTVPPGTDLSAGEPIVLDLLYICSGIGGLASLPVPVREPGTIRINVNTVSALQAYYAGSPLDFGEIGDASTTAVLAAPERYTTPAGNSLRVRSSGPFEVRMRSQNDFRLTYPGGNLGDASQAIRYSARFLGQEVTSNASFGTRTCARAGMDGSAGVLPLRATLKEGGAAKTPAPNYSDVISITFTPVVTAASASNCAGL